MTVEGIDVSVFQGGIDWPQAARGRGFAIARATVGMGVDPSYRRNAQGAFNAGLPVGSYHAADTRHDAAQQAHHHAMVAGAVQLPPVLDFEGSGNMPPLASLAWLREYIEEIEALTGKLCVLYTYPDFWNRFVAALPEGVLDWLKPKPLWLARYWQDAPYTPAIGDWPKPLAPWDKVTLWQYSGDHGARVPGIHVPCDRDRWLGTEDEFCAFVSRAA